jgi:cytochrome P450
MTRHSPAPRTLFAPDPGVTPDRFLNLFEAARAAMRNPLELWDRALFSLPYRMIRRAGVRYMEIADPELMHDVLVKQIDCFEKSAVQQRYIKPALGNGLLAAEGDAWRLQRPAAAPCFRQQALDELIPVIDRVGRAAALRLAAHDGKLLDVMPVMMRATFDVVAELVLGPDASRIDQQIMADAVTAYVEEIALADAIDLAGGMAWLQHRPWSTRGQAGLAAMRGEAARVLTFRRKHAPVRQDLLARFMSARGRGSNAPMPEVDIRDNILTFLTAGNETTALTLTWALYLIANDPAVQARLRQEALDVIGDGPLQSEHIERLCFHLAAIKETMRLYPPIAILQRRVIAPVTIAGVTLKPGDEAVCAGYVMHRSALLWDNPDAFDPDRFSEERSKGRHNLALMPFGAGRHVCIGKPLAYMETTALLAMLVRQLRFSADGGYTPRPVMRLTVRPDQGMPLRVHASPPTTNGPAHSAHDFAEAV